MAISQEELERIKRRFEKQNKIILNLYKKTGDKSLLEMLYFDSDDAAEIAKKFGVSETDAENLAEKSRLESLYDNAFEIVAASGDESAENLSQKLGVSQGDAEKLIQKMKEKGDIASDEDNTEKTQETSGEDSYDSDFDDDLSDFPEKLIENLCFIGDVVQDTADKICDALDESVERICKKQF